MLLMCAFLISLISVPFLPFSLVIPLDKKHTNCLICQIKNFLLAAMSDFMKPFFPMHLSSPLPHQKLAHKFPKPAQSQLWPVTSLGPILLLPHQTLTCQITLPHLYQIHHLPLLHRRHHTCPLHLVTHRHLHHSHSHLLQLHHSSTHQPPLHQITPFLPLFLSVAQVARLFHRSRSRISSATMFTLTNHSLCRWVQPKELDILCLTTSHITDTRPITDPLLLKSAPSVNLSPIQRQLFILSGRRP